MDADTTAETLPGALARLPRFPSVDAFYDDDERRRYSPEWDYGVWWRSSDDGPRWPHWRVSWVCETGDLYAARQAGRPLVLLLGNVPPTGAYPYGLGMHAWHDWHLEQPVEQVLAGWPDVETLDWILDRLAGPVAA
jgi:hypothetical protein